MLDSLCCTYLLQVSLAVLEKTSNEDQDLCLLSAYLFPQEEELMCEERKQCERFIPVHMEWKLICFTHSGRFGVIRTA
jgi:hypothetical protein